MAYRLEGSLLEFCTCYAICPCWIGDDPDGGTCDVAVAWHFDKGTIDGVDVSGLTLGAMAHVPGNILEGNWRVVVVVDDNATRQQEEAILEVYTGKQGGPVADIVKLIGEVVGVERAPITFKAEKGKGTLKIGQAVDAEMVPYLNPKGEPTMLHNSVFSNRRASSSTRPRLRSMDSLAERTARGPFFRIGAAYRSAVSISPNPPKDGLGDSP